MSQPDRKYTLDDIIAASAGLYEHSDEDPNRDDPYLEEADANPERRNNGCLIYKVGS